MPVISCQDLHISLQDILRIADIPEEVEIDNQTQCAVCHDDIMDNCEDKIVLKCRHPFHYQCLLETYMGAQNRDCPYCRRMGEYLPLLPGQKPMKWVHKEYYLKKDIKKPKIKQLPIIIPGVPAVVGGLILCKGTTKTGKSCGYSPYPGNDGFCRIHKKIIN